MRILAVLLALLWAAPCLGQGVKLPAEIKVLPGTLFIVAPEVTDGWGKPKWKIDPNLQEQRLDLLLPPELVAQLRGKMFSGVTGTYRIEVWNGKKDSPEGEVSDVAVCTITIGSPGPLPPPIPPAPPVPPGPEPPVPPQPAGPRQVLIIRESAEDTPAQARMFTALQAGAQGKAIRAKGHAVWVLDDDAEDAAGNESAVIKSWRPHFAGMTLPVVIIYDSKTGAIISKTSLPVEANADDVVGLLNKAGG